MHIYDCQQQQYKSLLLLLFRTLINNQHVFTEGFFIRFSSAAEIYLNQLYNSLLVSIVSDFTAFEYLSYTIKELGCIKKNETLRRRKK